MNTWVGDEKTAEEIPPSWIANEWTRHMDVGGADLPLIYTLLHFQDPTIALEDMPHGKFKFRQSTAYVSPLKIGVVYQPVISEAEAAEAARVCGRDKAVVMSVTEKLGGDAHPGAPSVAPIRAYTADKSQFFQSPGILGQPGKAPVVTVPAAVKAAAQAVKSANPMGASAQAAVRRLQKSALARIPGATNANGKGVGTARGQLRSALSSEMD